MRGASARFIFAIANSNPGWQEAARVELIHALHVDYTAADMIISLVSIDLMLGRIDEAQAYYSQFKLAAKSSPLIKLVEQNRQQSRPAVAAHP
jgi:hypothetical protein